MTWAADVYGEALYDLAKGENLETRILEELSVLEESFGKEPEFLRLLSNPGISKQERCGVVDAVLKGNAHPYVGNFLKLLTEKGYARQFFQCVKAFRTHYNNDHGILPVVAVTAAPLTRAQMDKLTEKLAALTGKTVELANRLDEAVIGGVRLEYSGHLMDDTLQHRLESIRRTLKNTVL